MTNGDVLAAGAEVIRTPKKFVWCGGFGNNPFLCCFSRAWRSQRKPSAPSLQWKADFLKTGFLLNPDRPLHGRLRGFGPCCDNTNGSECRV
jgi:hypothetical protein